MTEITVLAWAGLLGAVHLLALSVVANTRMSTAWLAGPRDDDRALPPVVGRLKRALANHTEGLGFFIPAAVALTILDKSTPFTAACAWVYLGARVAYVPLYAFGVPWVRSAVWAVGFFATLAMLAVAVL